ncbi:MAG: response regulator, partial [Chloroflexi bacterium]|nr:response regulator [Chloroflexota bacterium]
EHIPVLARLSAAVGETRGDFLAQWKAILDQESAHPSLERMRAPNALDHAATVLLDSLHVAPNASVQNYLQTVAAWSTELYVSGLDYPDFVALWSTYRRALLPCLLHAYAAGPELTLVFAALDVQERAVLGIGAVMGIQVAHAQLAQGVHLRSVGRLTGGITHALNNTMAVIVGRAQIVEEQLTEEAQREELRTIQRIARAGADSLKRLQQFAFERDGHANTRLDVNTLINDVIQLTRFRWRDDAEASGISIEVVKDLDVVPPVMGQVSLLRDALVELILNSVEAMPLGGLVTIRTDRAEGRVVVLVSDQGVGMDAIAQARATEPFFTTKGAGHVGLGLTTVASMVREMNGTFSLASTPGEGATARITLPMAQPSAGPADLRQARLARWAKILVVDDEPLVRDVAARTFLLRGFQTVAADSGADALRVFTEQGPFEVVIVDLGMPGMNGFEVARALKDLNPKTIVILMTGWAAELDAKKMREAGIDRALAKPFDADQVIQLISEALAIQEKM